MNQPNMTVGVRCTYCQKPCSGEQRDHYGEWILKRDLPVCDECAEDFEHEQGPWNGW